MSVKSGPTVKKCLHATLHSSTWLFLSWLGQIGDTCVRAHEDVAGVQGPFQEALFGLRYMDTTQGGLRKSVGRYQSQAVDPDLVDAVYRLESDR